MRFAVKYRSDTSVEKVNSDFFERDSESDSVSIIVAQMRRKINKRKKKVARKYTIDESSVLEADLEVKSELD